jgi:hypothetical protein
MRIFKGVRGGTAGGEPLCNSCSNFGYRRGAGESQEILRCSGKPLPFRMFECSDYDDKRIEGVYDLMNRAWIILGDKRIVPSIEYNKMVEAKEVEWVDLNEASPLQK